MTAGPSSLHISYFYYYVFSLLKTVQGTAFLRSEVVMLRCWGFMFVYVRFHTINESLKITHCLGGCESLFSINSGYFSGACVSGKPLK